MSGHPMRKVRNQLLQSLYQWSMRPESLPDLLNAGQDLLEHQLVYARHLKRCVALLEQAQDKIVPMLADPDWERLLRVERMILLMAYYELSEVSDVPYRVIMNEAIELAKVYGGDDSYRLINGVIDRLACELRPWEKPARE